MSNNALRLIFATQSTGLSLFWRLQQALAKEGGLGRVGYFVTNRHEFSLFERYQAGFGHAGCDLLKEWDLLAKANSMAAPNLLQIDDWERRLGDASLWNALIIDRRLGYTLKAQFAQSYRPAYSHEALLKILQVALESIAAQFDRVQPHAVIGLNAVTLYDYLYYLMAKQRGIPYFQLKLTRIRNYVSLFTDPFALSPHITEVFHRLIQGVDCKESDYLALEDARAFLAESKGRTLVYEGAIKRPGGKQNKGTVARNTQGSRSVLSKMHAWSDRLIQVFSVQDTHYPTLLKTAFHAKVIRPLRRRFQGFRFDINDAAAYASEHAGKYAIYPLNTEPEVALLAFGRPYRNQIETVRNIAGSLPVGWKLVVKEHPNAYGYRSAGYYRKLKQIPNVVLASPMSDTGQLTDGCGLVTLVYGTIGLEAIIKGKPTLILCETPYGVFPPTMVRYTDSIWRMGHEIRDLLESYKYEEAPIVAFLAAHISTGIRINLFTGLLGKGGRQAGDETVSLDTQYVDLATYTRLRVAEEIARIECLKGGSDAPY